MPNGIGYVGDESHDKLILDLMELYRYYGGQLTDPFRRMGDHWRRYLTFRKDNRAPHEKWRAHTATPHAYSGVEVSVAVLSEIFNSADPPIQPEGIGPEDEKRAKLMQRALHYMLLKNRWQFTQDMHLREVKVQGTAFFKEIHVKRSTMIRYHPSLEDEANFDKAIDEAVERGAPEPPEDPDAFELWREQVNTARQYGHIPDPPTPGLKEVVEYRGPWLERVSPFDLRFDPMVEQWDEQPVIFHRIVKPRNWILARAGDDPLPFDAGQVEAALSSVGDRRFSEWQEQIADMMGITPGALTDPIHKDACELIEAWPHPDTGLPPYVLILNQRAAINKDPMTHPFFHGKRPIFGVRNVPIPGMALGLSDLHAPWSLYHEVDIFHDLVADALTLAVLPVFLKLKELGMPDMQRFLTPGAILDVSRPDGLHQVNKNPVAVAEVWRQIDSLKADIDETNATPPHVRGSQATVGRISATEQSSRLTQALQRKKQDVLRIEDEWYPIPRQAAGLFYQFWPEGLRLKIGGDDLGEDPMVIMDRGDLLESLDIDYRFRGATRALNPELSAQQLKDVMQTAHGMGALFPEETRKILTHILEILGHKGVARFITPEGTKAIEAARQAQAVAGAREQMAGRMAGQAAQTAGAANGNGQPAPEGDGEPAAEAPPA